VGGTRNPWCARKIAACSAAFDRRYPGERTTDDETAAASISAKTRPLRGWDRVPIELEDHARRSGRCVGVGSGILQAFEDSDPWASRKVFQHRTEMMPSGGRCDAGTRGSSSQASR